MTVVMSIAWISLNICLLFCFATDNKKEYSNAVCEGRWSHLSLTTITCWTLKYRCFHLKISTHRSSKGFLKSIVFIALIFIHFSKKVLV